MQRGKGERSTKILSRKQPRDVFRQQFQRGRIFFLGRSSNGEYVPSFKISQLLILALPFDSQKLGVSFYLDVCAQPRRFLVSGTCPYVGVPFYLGGGDWFIFSVLIQRIMRPSSVSRSLIFFLRQITHGALQISFSKWEHFQPFRYFFPLSDFDPILPF